VGLDIRKPIGLMFLLLGLLLGAYGLWSDPAIYSKSLDLNVNLIWGTVLEVFGAVMFVLGRRGAQNPPKSNHDGDATAR
jgi:hypothetical protein